jgi:hypothetical protein
MSRWYEAGPPKTLGEWIFKVFVAIILLCVWLLLLAGLGYVVYLFRYGLAVVLIPQLFVLSPFIILGVPVVLVGSVEKLCKYMRGKARKARRFTDFFRETSTF